MSTMTRQEFDDALDGETVLGLIGDRTRFKGLRQLAEGYKREDIAAILDGVITALDTAIHQAEQLRRPATGTAS